MTSVYVYDKNQCKVVPMDERTDGPITNRGRTNEGGPNIIMDIEPYHGVGFPGGPMVTTRSQHRELLKRHNKIEVGNEMSTTMREKIREKKERRLENAG
jgi:hypothetical protein